MRALFIPGFLVAALAWLPPQGWAQGSIDIEVLGEWSFEITDQDLVGGAGSDLPPVYQSKADQAWVNIRTRAIDQKWRVDVRRSDANWPRNVSLFVRRTDDGEGPGTIWGGRTYVEVTATDTFFFSGAGDRSWVYLQFKLGGISVRVPPDTYSTTVVFTVVEE